MDGTDIAEVKHPELCSTSGSTVRHQNVTAAGTDSPWRAHISEGGYLYELLNTKRPPDKYIDNNTNDDGDEFEIEWRSYALSACKAMFMARVSEWVVV